MYKVSLVFNGVKVAIPVEAVSSQVAIQAIEDFIASFQLKKSMQISASVEEIDGS